MVDRGGLEDVVAVPCEVLRAPSGQCLREQQEEVDRAFELFHLLFRLLQAFPDLVELLDVKDEHHGLGKLGNKLLLTQLRVVLVFRSRDYPEWRAAVQRVVLLKGACGRVEAGHCQAFAVVDARPVQLRVL